MREPRPVAALLPIAVTSAALLLAACGPVTFSQRSSAETSDGPDASATTSDPTGERSATTSGTSAPSSAGSPAPRPATVEKSPAPMPAPPATSDGPTAAPAAPPVAAPAPPTGCDPASVMPRYPGRGTGQDNHLVGGNLDACGFAGPESTGPRPGTDFTECRDLRFGGSSRNTVNVGGGSCWLDLRDATTVIEGVRGITGITVRGDVTIRDSIIASEDTGTRVNTGLVTTQPDSRLVIEHSLLDGGARTGDRPVFQPYGSVVVRSSEFVHCGPGCVEGNRWEVYDSYLHDFVGIDGNHVDGLQTNGGENLVAVGNTIIAMNAYHDETVPSHGNAAIALFADLGTISGGRIEGNLLAGGGGTVYLQTKKYRLSGVTFRDNVYSLAYFDRERAGSRGWVGSYGPLYPEGVPADTAWSGNRILETGATISVDEARSRWR
jgi:hypothetical protein